MMIQTKHFELSFCENDEAYAVKISRMIEDVYSQIITTFALADSEETFRFVLCRDIPEYLRETGKTADDYEPWYLLHRYGAEVFKALYTGERDIQPYITETFEKDALAAFFCKETQKGAFCK